MLVAVGAAVEVVRNAVGLVDQFELHDVGLVVGCEGGNLSGPAVLEVIAVVLRPLRAILADADHLGLGDGVVLGVVLRQHRAVHYIPNGVLDVTEFRVGERDVVLARDEIDGLHAEIGNEAGEVAGELVLGKGRHLYGGAHLAATGDRINDIRAVGGLVVDGVIDGGARLPHGVDGDIVGDRVIDVDQPGFARDGIVVRDETRGPADEVVALLDGRGLQGLGAGERLALDHLELGLAGGKRHALAERDGHRFFRCGPYGVKNKIVGRHSHELVGFVNACTVLEPADEHGVSVHSSRARGGEAVLRACDIGLIQDSGLGFYRAIVGIAIRDLERRAIVVKLVCVFSLVPGRFIGLGSVASDLLGAKPVASSLRLLAVHFRLFISTISLL